MLTIHLTRTSSKVSHSVPNVTKLIHVPGLQRRVVDRTELQISKCRAFLLFFHGGVWHRSTRLTIAGHWGAVLFVKEKQAASIFQASSSPLNNSHHTVQVWFPHKAPPTHKPCDNGGYRSHVFRILSASRTFKKYGPLTVECGHITLLRT